MTEECLTDEVVLAFVAGALEAPAVDKVHEHLDGCDDCRQLVAEVAKAHFETSAPRSLPELSGRTVDRYQVMRAIGAGGMGIVYLAEDTQLHRKVALKFPRAPIGTDSSDDQHRLLAEARAMARLAHPNVVGVYEAGTYEDQVFVAMEYVDGITLKDWLRAGDRSWREILAKLGDAGRGLAAAHAAGLVHRDFKPENVLIDQEGRVRVSDFGLARPVHAQEVSHAGTPSYMAPEQVKGDKVDERSDQFSFCVTPLRGALRGPTVCKPSAETLPHASSFRILAEPPKGTRVPTWLRRVLERGLQEIGRSPWFDAGAAGSARSAALATLAGDGGARVRRDRDRARVRAGAGAPRPASRGALRATAEPELPARRVLLVPHLEQLRRGRRARHLRAAAGPRRVPGVEQAGLRVRWQDL